MNVIQINTSVCACRGSKDTGCYRVTWRWWKIGKKYELEPLKWSGWLKKTSHGAPPCSHFVALTYSVCLFGSDIFVVHIINNLNNKYENSFYKSY